MSTSPWWWSRSSTAATTPSTLRPWPTPARPTRRPNGGFAHERDRPSPLAGEQAEGRRGGRFRYGAERLWGVTAVSLLSRRSAVVLFFVISGVPIALLVYWSIAISTDSAVRQAQKGAADS